VAENRTAQKAVKNLIKSAGGEMSANAVGKLAAHATHLFAAVSIGISAVAGYNEYRACMAY
jgi:uncharacterized protein YgbK (DUF1537 family)